MTQLVGDSRTIDLSPWYGTIDFVVVDGGHDYASVRSDSLNALELLAPGGVVFWDDYAPQWPDVVRAVDDVAAASALRPIRLEGTEVAVHDPRAALPS